jgi:hypothetical protein
MGKADIKGSWALIEIDFMGGLHGRFLCYSINALDPDNRIKSPFTVFGTSHICYKKTLATAKHYTHSKIPFESTDIISITADDADCLLVNLLSYGRAGDYNFDLKNFNINFYDQLKNTPYKDTINHLNSSYNIDVSKTNSISRKILREYFKFNYIDYTENNILKEIRKQIYPINVLEINFREFYIFDSYIAILDQVINRFKLDYIVDTEWYQRLWTEFINKIDAIQLNTDAFETLAAIQQGKSKSIDFNLLQESWLNARLEVLYNKEMPFNQEQYFSNTVDIIKYLET